MAGDWMKIDLTLPDKPEVWQISGILSLDPDAVVGKLVKVWRWFDMHTEDGNANGVTFTLVDSISGVTGFAEAMWFVGWLKQSGDMLSCPKFDRHNGKTAKNRALTAKRVASFKGKSNEKGNALIVTDALPREEKRREDIKAIQSSPSAQEKRQTKKTPIPENFSVSESVKAWAAREGHRDLDRHLAYFATYAKASGKTYANWDAAFMNAIRGNWAKLPSVNITPSVRRPEVTL